MLAKDNNSIPPRQNGEGVPAKRAGERSDNAVHNSSQNINKNMRPKKAHIFLCHPAPGRRAVSNSGCNPGEPDGCSIPRLEGATSVTPGVRS